MTDRETFLDDAERLRVAIGAFIRRVRDHDTMPPGQAAVLGHLARDGDLSITDLADREKVRHQSMARTVKLLQGQGLIDVVTDPADRRRVSARITATGRTRLDAERQARAAWIAEAIGSRLTLDEQDLVRRIPGLLEALGRHDPNAGPPVQP